ncbi:MAG: glycosyltransferase family 4 protein [Lachnospiraceae bacterium]
MRIMIAVATYWPSQDGVANITGYLAEGLAAKGHDLFVLTSERNDSREMLPIQESHNHVNIVRMRVCTRWPLWIKGLDKTSSSKAYREHIRKYRPDVLIVVCSQTWTFDWIIPYLQELDCVKVFYSHGYSMWQEKYSYADAYKNGRLLGVRIAYKCKKYYDNLYKYIRQFDRTIYISEAGEAAVYAEKHGLTNGRILKNAIDDRFYEDDMIHDYYEKGILRYLFVANYNENKNQEMLIRAFEKADIGKSQLILVGYEENEYYKHLNDIIGELEDKLKLKDKEIVFHTHISREKVIDLYRTSDVFVCSSKTETYSIVAHEAAATGMPIISTDVGIYSKIAGAYIIKDTEQMAHAMEDLYDHEAERRRRGTAVREWIQGEGCRVQDKVEWLEKDLLGILETKKA